jgi:exopolyphosphatase/guanosine-5'-triphosphate,3'-diphosphate pyrophosphatase
MLIAGEGLREGIAYDALDAATLSLAAVRYAAVQALAHQFATWDQARAERRAALAARLSAALEPDLAPEWQELLQTAALLLDIGRSIDYYNRFTHTASIVVQAHLGGFSHRELAQLAVLIREAEKGKPLGPEVALLEGDEAGTISRLALLLALADEFERHRFDACAAEPLIEVGDQAVQLASPPLTDAKVAEFGERFQRLYGRPLELREPSPGRESVQDELPVP